MNLSIISVLAWGVVMGFGATEVRAATQTFFYCSEASPSSFNPQLATDGTSFNASSKTIYNRLVEFKPGETTLTPGLAESWKISQDGRTYTFKLRSGVKWHSSKDFQPTRDFNADDVAFTFHRQMDSKHPFHRVSGGTYEYFRAMEMDQAIESVRKVDPMTVEIRLKNPESPFLANLAMDFASILSAEYGEKMLQAKTPEKLDLQPIGTGPFVFQSYTKDNSIRYRANAEYWGGKPAIDRLIFAITPDPSVRYQKLKTGECHFVTEPAPADLAAMKKDASIAIDEQAGLNVAYLALNVKKKPFDNVLVRRAVHHAMNRAAYIDAVYLGNAQVAKNPIPPTMWSYNKKTRDYDYSVEKAKALLAQAGYPNGFETEMWTIPVSRPYLPNGKRMGELMQADLARVGIKVKLVTYDWPTYLAKSKKGEHTMLQIGWTGDNGDPDNFLQVLLGCAAIESGSNYSQWCNKDFDRLISQARRVSDLKERTRLYEKAQEIFKQDAPWVTLAHSTVFRAMNKDVKGFRMDPFGSDVFTRVSLK